MIRGTTGWKCIAAGTILGCVFLLQSVAHGQQTNDPQLRETVSDTLIGLSHSPPVSPGHPYIDICGETVKTWKDKPEVIPILMEFVTNGLSLRCDKQRHLVTPHTRQEQQAYYCAMNGIVMLGLLRAKPASGLLAEVAGRTDIVRFFQEAAIRAVIRIGDTNMLDFATDVCTHPEKFGNVASLFDVFRELGYYADPRTEDSRRSAVIEFLLQYKDHPDWGTVSAVDEALCTADEEYSTSHEREAILVKFKDAPFYYPKALKAIKALPAERRTHVDWKTLATKQPSVKPPATNTPPVTPKAN